MLLFPTGRQAEWEETSFAPIAAALFIVMIGKSVVAYGIVRAFRHPPNTAGLIASSLAQIGEFSFILAALGVSVGLLPEQGRDLIVTTAILSIMLNPLVFIVADRLAPRRDDTLAKAAEPEPAEELQKTTLSGHVILVGLGRVGRIVAKGLQDSGRKFLVIEDDEHRIAELNAAGTPHVVGNGVLHEVLDAANVAGAKLLVIAIPNGFEASGIVVHARERNPGLRIVARAHSDEEVALLRKHGSNMVIMGEQEIAQGMLAYAASAMDDAAPQPVEPSPPVAAAHEATDPAPAPAPTPGDATSDAAVTTRDDEAKPPQP